MKVSKRPTPLDMLSFEHKNYRVSVFTEGQRIIAVRVSKDGETIHEQNLTPEMFISLLMRDAKP